MPEGLTITFIFDAMSLNYGEGIGNISELKKLSKAGKQFTYLSRQAIRFDLFRMLQESYNTDRDKSSPLTEDNKVVQFRDTATIEEYAEMDLFGYMKTKPKIGAVTRSAVVRLSPAVSLEPFNNDLEFGSNKNFADRVSESGNKTVFPNPFQFEHHSSLYSYTLTIDLEKIGVDPHDDINISRDEKKNRVVQVLNSLKVLNREIKARTESLNPLFAIGGVYPVKNPFFLNRIKVRYDNSSDTYTINTDLLTSSANKTYNDVNIGELTCIGYDKGFWQNEADFSGVTEHVYSIEEFFSTIIKKVNDYYDNFKD